MNEINKEQAEKEFSELLQARRLEERAEKQPAAVAQLKEMLVKELMVGRAVVDGATLTYSAPSGTSFKWKKVTGSVFLIGDQLAESQGLRKTVLQAADLTGVQSKEITALPLDEFNVVIGVTQLFLV